MLWQRHSQCVLLDFEEICKRLEEGSVSLQLCLLAPSTPCSLPRLKSAFSYVNSYTHVCTVKESSNSAYSTKSSSHVILIVDFATWLVHCTVMAFLKGGTLELATSTVV